MEKSMVQVLSYGIRQQFTKENGKMTKFMVKGY
jgi:hypothetical protein